MVEDKRERNRAVVDRLIEAMLTDDGRKEVPVILAEFIDSFADDETKIVELMFLVMTAAETAADRSTVVNIWDPQRRVDPKKALRLAQQTNAATRDLGREIQRSKKELRHG